MLKKWPLRHRILFLAALFLFWIQGVIFAFSLGSGTSFHNDAYTESFSIFAANHYLDHGLLEHYLLPTYPAFGHGPDGVRRTEPFVYNHYLAGPDFVLYGVLKVFGRNAVWVARLVPHTLTVLAMGAMAVEFGLLMSSTWMAIFLLAMLLIPRALTAWSTCVYGHSYVMAFYLFMVVVILRMARSSKKIATPRLIGVGALIGALQMFFDLDWVPLTFLSACSLFLVFENIPKAQIKRFLVGIVLGAMAALFYQLLVSSLEFGSFEWVMNNIQQWVRFRNGTDIVPEMTVGDMRLHKVLAEYNRQAYGATGMTAYNWLILGAVFVLLGYLSKAYSVKRARRLIAALGVSFLAAASWLLIMRQHAVAHMHFLPRHYFVIFMTFTLVVLPICRDIVVRARR